MTCPNCGFEGLRPARDWGDGRRDYTCWSCGYKFSTVEMIVEVAQRQAFQASMFRLIKGE